MRNTFALTLCVFSFSPSFSFSIFFLLKITPPDENEETEKEREREGERERKRKTVATQKGSEKWRRLLPEKLISRGKDGAPAVSSSADLARVEGTRRETLFSKATSSDGLKYVAGSVQNGKFTEQIQSLYKQLENKKRYFFKYIRTLYKYFER